MGLRATRHVPKAVDARLEQGLETLLPGPVTGRVPHVRTAACPCVSSLLVLMSPAALEHIHPARAHVETPLGDPFIKCCKEDVSSMGTRPGSAGERRSFSNLSNSLGRVLSAGAPRRLWRRETGGTQGTGWERRARTSFPAGRPSGGWRMGARGRKAPAISSRARRAHAVGSPCTHAWLGMSRRQGERPWGTQVTRMPYAAAVAV